MTRTALENLEDDAYVWIFGVSPAVSGSSGAQLLRRVDEFLDGWTAHNEPVLAGREFRDGSFLVIAAAPQSERSGCSIDRMFGTLQSLERDLGVKILDPNRVFFRHGDGRVDAITRAEFRERGDPHTIVFDTTVERLGDVRGGKWERKAEESWHRELLKKAVQRG